MSRDAPAAVTVLAVDAPVVADTITALHDHVTDAMRGGRKAFVIDLGGVDGITTSVVSLLCAEIRQLQHEGAALAVADADLLVVSVLGLCRLHGLGLYPSVGLAVEALQGEDPARSPAPPLVQPITANQADNVFPSSAATLNVTDPVRVAHAGVGGAVAARRGILPFLRRAGNPSE